MWPFSSSSSPTSAAAAGAADKCPVDEETRQAWLRANPGKAHPFQPDSPAPKQEHDSQPGPSRPRYNDESRLSTDREISSIPRSYSRLASPTAAQAAQPPSTADEDTDGKWVYPSAKQFYNAMKRKNQNPQVADMDVVVPIHNAVNEQAWRHILAWERMWTAESDTKLISFKGRPRDLTWRAWFNTLAGYQPPFDRHDWTIERPNGEQLWCWCTVQGRPELLFGCKTRAVDDPGHGYECRVEAGMGFFRTVAKGDRCGRVTLEGKLASQRDLRIGHLAPLPKSQIRPRAPRGRIFARRHHHHPLSCLCTLGHLLRTSASPATLAKRTAYSVSL
ncbi:hypothetical protein L1887_48208 [Cichorium endivia]|nr:hypothetical protein L1887_48208 [Cichorium endivia]